jgi:hypothetical protein
MNSATSTEAPVAVHAGGSAGKSSAKDAGFQPWHFFVLASLLLATVAVIMSRQSTPEHLVLISFTIGAAGAAAAGFYRMLLPLTVDDVATLREPLSDRSREALLREKTLVLRSIKELEFDRAMRKVSDKDFEDVGGRLRARAIALMKQLEEDGAGYRALIEKELAARLAAAPRQGATIDGSPRPAAIAVAGVFCTACGTRSDVDARFCKRCGTRLEQDAPA